VIPLVLRAEIDGCEDDVVCRAVPDERTSEYDIEVVATADGAMITAQSWRARVHGVAAADLAGDVLLVQPKRGIVQRLIRKTSPHNTLLITERCDQLCVMCSQPPKKTHEDQFRHYKVACLLAPQDAVIGLSGGEPTLYKEELFDLLSFALSMRPDLSFHVLTNAQHFVEGDVEFLASDIGRKILWGVPLYASEPDLHDRLVGKVGAFHQLQRGLSILCRSGAPTELRTVVMTENARELPRLARHIARHISFASPWAIMQLENTGYAKNRWNDLFYDHSEDFTPIAEAVDVARINGLTAMLYNFPLCTVPRAYRRLSPSTISDWKRRYEPACETCKARHWCSGFFEWHPSQASYQHLEPL
jgi:His-Xaa-Ser system radical SAM maturase HxsC